MSLKSSSDPAIHEPVQTNSNSGSRVVPRRWFLAVMTMFLLLPARSKSQAVAPDDIVGNGEAIDNTL